MTNTFEAKAEEILKITDKNIIYTVKLNIELVKIKKFANKAVSMTLNSYMGV